MPYRTFRNSSNLDDVRTDVQYTKYAVIEHVDRLFGSFVMIGVLFFALACVMGLGFYGRTMDRFRVIEKRLEQCERRSEDRQVDMQGRLKNLSLDHWRLTTENEELLHNTKRIIHENQRFQVEQNVGME